MSDTFDVARWKAEFDLTMEQINKSLEETKRIHDGLELARARRERTHLHLVSPVESDDEDDA
jgi:hypothetical protein